MRDVLEASLKQVASSIDEHIRKMDTCLSHRDLHGFSIEAHGLKGALANIGAMHNSELSAELEIASKAENIPLCEKKFASFTGRMESFALELRAVFSEAENKIKQQGDKEFLTLKTNNVIENLDNFEAADALRCLNELDSFTFGDEIDAMLSDARNLIEAFDYDKAATLLKGIS